jgi:hypothetical protein
LDRRLGGPQSRSGSYGEEKNLLAHIILYSKQQINIMAHSIISETHLGIFLMPVAVGLGICQYSFTMERIP